MVYLHKQIQIGDSIVTAPPTHQDISFDVAIVNENKIGCKNHLTSSACWHPYLEGEMAESLLLCILCQCLACHSHVCFPSINYLPFPCSYLSLKEIYFPGFFALCFLDTFSQWESSERDIRMEEEEKTLFSFFGMSFAALDTLYHQVNFHQVVLAPGPASIIFFSPSSSYLRQWKTKAKVLKSSLYSIHSI